MKEIIPKATVAERLKLLRGNKGQKEVAAGIGIKLKRYNSYECAKREMSATLLLKVFQYYKITTIEQFLG